MASLTVSPLPGYGYATYKITGVTAYKPNNKDLTADPLSPIAAHKVRAKALLKKKKFTDREPEYYHWLDRVDWLASLYTDKAIKHDIRSDAMPLHCEIPDTDALLVIPSSAFISMMQNVNTKKFKNLIKAGCLVDDDPVLDYPNGPISIKSMLEQEKYRHVQLVRVEGPNNKLNWVRTVTPIFHKWSCTVTIYFLAELIGLVQIKEWVECAAKFGLGLGRPKYGRFNAELLESFEPKVQSLLEDEEEEVGA